MNLKTVVQMVLIVFLTICKTALAYDPGNCDTYLSPDDNLVDEINGVQGPYVFCLEAGNYDVDQTIEVGANVTIHGLHGSTDVVIHSTAETRGITTIENNVSLHGFTLDGDGSSMSVYGILFYENQGGSISSVRVQNLGGRGLGLVNSDNFIANYMVIKNNGTVPEGQQAIWYYLSDNVQLLNITVEGNNQANGADGSITCYSGNNITVKWVKSFHSGSAGIGAWMCKNLEIAHNEMYYGSEFGIDIANGSANGNIHDNFIFGADHTAIVFTNHNWTEGYIGTPPSNFTVTNNTMQSNNRIGYWDGACNNGDDIDAIVLVNVPIGNNITVGTGNTTDSGPISCHATKP